MNMLQIIRHWQRRSALRIFGVLVAVWLNLALQSCAMAAMPADDCPHCPPGMHDSEMPMIATDCALIDLIDDPDIVGPQNKSDTSIEAVPLAVLTELLPIDLRTSDARMQRCKTARSVHGPPLNELFCVYLK